MFFYKTLVVHENEAALIYRDGHLQETVRAGKYRLWGWHRRTVVFDMEWLGYQNVRPDRPAAISLFAINGNHFNWIGPWQQIQGGWRTPT